MVAYVLEPQEKDKGVPIDPWSQAYSPIAAEFFGMLLYTLFSRKM